MLHLTQPKVFVEDGLLEAAFHVNARVGDKLASFECSHVGHVEESTEKYIKRTKHGCEYVGKLE